MYCTWSLLTPRVWQAPLVAFLWTGAAFGQAQNETSEEDTSPLETRVLERRDRVPRSGDAVNLDNDWAASSQPEDAIEALSGVSLARDGGPMAPVRFSMRGLSGPRTQVSLGDLALDDPATGAFDVAFLPLFAADRLSYAAGMGTESVPGSRLQIDALPSSSRGLRAQIGWGSLQTMRAQLGTHFTALNDDTYLAAMQMGRSDGNFRFQPISPSDALPAPAIERQNNDQQRAALYLRGEQTMGDTQLTWAAFGGSHQGGIPGFATAPTDGMRGENGLVHSQLRLRLPVRDTKLAIQSTFRLGTNRVYSPQTGQQNRMSSASNGLFSEVYFPTWRTPNLRFDSWLQLSAQLSRVLGTTLTRAGYKTLVGAVLELPTAKLQLQSQLSVAHFNDVGWLPEGSIGVEYAPFRVLRAGIRLVQSGRPPTLDEMYAPRGLVLGNPKLKMESGFESEAYLRFSRNSIFDAHVSVFVGRMNDAIVFLNRNAFEILPLNTGPVVRTGWSSRTRVRPHSWFEMRLSSTQLWTQMEVTQSPLPTIPPLFARLEHRFGPQAGFHVSVAMRYRARTFSSLHGTLAVPAYLLWDTILRLPVASRWLVSLSLTNLADVQTAQDVNLLPLPGRQFFCSLEYRYDAT